MEQPQPNRRVPDMRALLSIARTAARTWPELAPLGGKKWTPEDIDRGVSIAYEISQSEAFLSEFPEGLNGDHSRTYLLTSVRNGLLRNKKRNSKIELIADIVLDCLPSTRDRIPRLLAPDAHMLAERVLAMLDDDAVAVLRRRLEGEEEGKGDRGAPCRPEGPSTRTQDRLWKKVKAVLVKVADEEGLGRGEMNDTLASLRAILAGRGQSRFCSRFLGVESPPRDSVL